MKTIERNGKRWAWPDHDEKLLQVFDWVDDIEYIMQFVDNPGLCIQAGGACGQWPLRFSEIFTEVVTFEPDMVNYGCLLQNINGAENIKSFRLAIGSEFKKVKLLLDETEENNCGAYYTDHGCDVLQVTLDAFGFKPDLIQLDIEGAEYGALVGARETLKHKPVVVIEEKSLPHHRNYTDAREFLENLGYKQVGQIHRDVVFKWGS